MDRGPKPLGGKAYGHIPHLPGSRMGIGDHHCHDGQFRICCEKPRDKHDRIIVQEKVDGSCVCAAKIGGEIVALLRSGYLATSSSFEQHHLWDAWVKESAWRFDRVLGEGERVCGEWLAQAHGTRYALPHEPFVLFDLFERDGTRLVFDEVWSRTSQYFVNPRSLFVGDGVSAPLSEILPMLERSFHGAIDPVEGAVWRVERAGRVDFLAKYVRPDKVDGCYLPEKNGGQSVWNWRPER